MTNPCFQIFTAKIIEWYFFDLSTGYFLLKNAFKTEPDLEITDDILEKIDSDYEIKIVLKSLEFCK